MDGKDKTLFFVCAWYGACTTQEFAPQALPLWVFFTKSTHHSTSNRICFRWSDLYTCVFAERQNKLVFISKYTVIVRVKIEAHCEKIRIFLSFCLILILFVPNLLQFWWKTKYNHTPADNVPSPLFKCLMTTFRLVFSLITFSCWWLHRKAGTSSAINLPLQFEATQQGWHYSGKIVWKCSFKFETGAHFYYLFIEASL